MFSHLSKRLSLSQKEVFLWTFTVLLLISVATGLRLYNLGNPQEYYFDEVYHAMTAKLVARNDHRAFEWTHGDTIEPNTYVEWLHPPLAKYVQAAGILVFGETGFGWRIGGALFGIATIVLIGAVTQYYFAKPWLTCLAMALATTETLLLAQSRISMNDIEVAFFMLLTVLVYLWYRRKPIYSRLLAVGLSAGLAVASKWSGVFILTWVALIESWEMLVLLRTTPGYRSFFSITTGVLTRLAALILLPLLVYLGSYWLMFQQGKTLAYFSELHSQIFAYQLHLDATHPYQSQPWQWFLDLKPVWYYVAYNQPRTDIYAVGNPVIFWLGAVVTVLSSMYLLTAAWGSRQRWWNTSKKNCHRPLLLHPLPANELYSLGLLTSAYWLTWLPWTLSPRIMFFYHYLPAVPLMIIITAFWLHKGWNSVKKLPQSRSTTALLISIPLLLVVNLVVFIWLLPQVLAVPIPEWWKQSLFLFGIWQ